MSLMEDTQRYWTLNRSFWSLGMHKLAYSPIHLQMREIASSTSGSKLKAIISRCYGTPEQAGAGGG